MTLFTFNDTIPNSGNNPSADQPIMLANNVASQGIIAVDHVGYNTTNGGYHTIIHQGPQAADPSAIAGFGQTYTKTISGDQQLFYESGGGVVSQLTATQNFNTSANGTLNITTSPQTVFTLPNNSVGIVMFSATGILTQSYTFGFFSISGVLYVQPSSNASIGTITLLANASGLNFQISRSGGANYISTYKYIYWPI